MKAALSQAIVILWQKTCQPSLWWYNAGKKIAKYWEVIVTTVFGKEGRDLYNAFFIPNTMMRRIELSQWVTSTARIVQAAVTQELKDFVESFTENAMTEQGWRYAEAKRRQMQDDYTLVMDIKLRKVSPKEQVRGSMLDPVVRQTEIDLHGMTPDDAMWTVKKFLHDSYDAHERRIWIIHGRGQGILRDKVRKYFEDHPLIESFTTADQSHGADGATQVDIKEWEFS